MTVISATYKNQPLALLNSNDKQTMLWNTHPVHISPEEEKTIDIDRLINILQDQKLLPSNALPNSDNLSLCALVSKLDRVFSSELKKYKETLDKAENDDTKIIQAYERQYHIQEDFPWYSRAWNSLIFKKKYIPRNTFQRETRVHRFTCLIQLDTLEKKRLESMKESIQIALTPVISNLEQSKDATLVNKDLFRTAKQLYQVFKTHFPDETVEQEEVIKDIINRMEYKHDFNDT